MNIAAYVELNVFALAFLLIISANIYHHGDRRLLEQKLFLGLLALNIMQLLLDSAQWMLDGVPGVVPGVASRLVALLCCAATPALSFTWSLYADYQIYHNSEHLGKFFRWSMIPVAANAALAVASVFTGLLFEIDRNNYYHRGPLFYLMVGICYFYIFYTLSVIWLRRKQLKRKTYLSLLLFAVPPFIGGLVQSLFYGVSVVWACAALSLMIIFINLQNSLLYTDHLTGLHNRRQLDNQLQEWCRSIPRDGLLGGIIVDIDCFKQINDELGHDMGDRALVQAARILQGSFKKDDLICRYGGDEFVVILKIARPDELSHAVERLNDATEAFNTRKEAPFSIRFSTGFAVYRCGEGKDPQQFLKQMDTMLYEQKAHKKTQGDRV